jgi:transposase
VQAVLQTIAALDLQPLYDTFRGTGSKPYRPELMLGIALFEILNRVSSPAKWCRDAKTRDQCKFLGQGITPARSVWYTFRDRCGKFIDQVHQQMIDMACRQEVVDPSECCLDGTFTRAAASRHKRFNLKRISRRLGKLKKAIRLLDHYDQDQCDHAIAGWIASTPQGRQEQLDRYRAAKARLLDQVAENRGKPKKYRRDEDNILISPMDIDAVFGRDKEKVLCPLYNTQYMVACGSGVIMAYDVFAKTNDTGTLAPMIELTQSIVNGRLGKVHADKGYCSLLELQDCDKFGVELYAPVQNHSRGNGSKSVDGDALFSQRDFQHSLEDESCRCPAGHLMPKRARGRKVRAEGRSVVEVRYEQTVELCSQCPLAKHCIKPGARRRTLTRLEGQERLDSQQAKMATDFGKRSAGLRGQTVERAFGDGKLHRNQNEQNGRGLIRVKAEVGLLVVAQNLLRLYNLRKRQPTAVP